MTYIIIIVLIAFSALFSGLTLGLMGLNVFELKRKMELGDSDAKKVYPIRKRGNELLTALLLGNVAVNAVIAIFLSSVSSGVIAGIISTTLIFLFGEIIPQAVISRFALSFGAKTTWIVKILLFIFYPITKPISLFLDYVLGQELPVIYTKQEIKKIITEHEDSPDSLVDADEEKIVLGALSFSEKTAKDIMTPRTVVFMIEQQQIIDTLFLEKLRDAYFSRVPVFNTNQDTIVGLLHIKDLVGVQTGIVKDIMRTDFLDIDEIIFLDELKNRMLKTKQHMAIVRDEFGGFAGVVTLEDILEEVIGREILDESDDHADLQELARKNKRPKNIE